MNAKIQAGIALIMEGLKEAATPQPEPLRNNAQIARALNIHKDLVAKLKKEGKVRTFDKGRKAYASDIAKALQDTPANIRIEREPRRAKEQRKQQATRIDVVEK